MKKNNSIADAIREIKKGCPIILIDDPGRENEGDFFFPAALVTSKLVNLMLQKGRGLVCVAITPEQAFRLWLPLMVASAENTEKTKVNFTVSVNASHGITTGISALDRAKTIRILSNPKSQPKDLVRPGHVFPLVAAAGGLKERQGHTEAAVELAALAGFSPVGVLCEIIREDGRMAKSPDLTKVAKENNHKMVFISELTKYLRKQGGKIKPQPSVTRTATAKLPTEYGVFDITVYESLQDNREHTALSMGKLNSGESVLVRIHSQCLTGDTLLSLRCDCREQLHESMRRVAQAGQGIILYLNQEGRGIGLSNKVRAYSLQEQGLDTVEANHALGFAPDARDYQIAAEILRYMDVTKISLLTNNPEKEMQLANSGIRISKRIPLETVPNKINVKYLRIKKQKLGHQLKYV